MHRLLRSAIALLFLVNCTGTSEKPVKEPVTISGYELLHVKLSPSRKSRGVDGEVRNWESAYIVRLITTMPEQEGLHVNFYIGGWKVPEYGGWKGGVYFYVYDPARLKWMDGKPFAYSAGAQPRKDTRIIFTSQTPTSMPEIKESEFYPNRK